jgi:hypothetical protein
MRRLMSCSGRTPPRDDVVTMTHLLGALLLIAGPAMIVLDLLVAGSTGERPSRLRIRYAQLVPAGSQGFAVVLICALGIAAVAAGLDLLRT